MTLKYSNFFFLQKLHPTSPVSTPFPNYPIFKSIPKSSNPQILKSPHPQINSLHPIFKFSNSQIFKLV
jgi:hypothetical protein